MGCFFRALSLHLLSFTVSLALVACGGAGAPGGAGGAAGILAPEISPHNLNNNSLAASSYKFKVFAGSSTTGSNNGTGVAAQFRQAKGIAVDSVGNVFVGDSCWIRKITPAGVVTTFAGQATVCAQTNGIGAAATFNHPVGLAIDASDTIYVADMSSQQIRKITKDGVVSTVAGQALTNGAVDGNGAAARFNNPQGVAVDTAGNIYVADTDNNQIRKITPDNSVIRFAGGTTQGFRDGAGAFAEFLRPSGLVVDTADNLFVLDQLGQVIRKVTPLGEVTTFAGNPKIGCTVDGIGTAASFCQLQGITIDPKNNIFVADYATGKVRRITPDAVVTSIVTFLRDTPYGLAINSSGDLFAACSNEIEELAP